MFSPYGGAPRPSHYTLPLRAPPRFPLPVGAGRPTTLGILRFSPGFTVVVVVVLHTPLRYRLAVAAHVTITIYTRFTGAVLLPVTRLLRYHTPVCVHLPVVTGLLIWSTRLHSELRFDAIHLHFIICCLTPPLPFPRSYDGTLLHSTMILIAPTISRLRCCCSVHLLFYAFIVPPRFVCRFDGATFTPFGRTTHLYVYVWLFYVAYTLFRLPLLRYHHTRIQVRYILLRFGAVLRLFWFTTA